MANDNLLALFTGLAEGAANVILPFAKARYDTNLQKELYAYKQPLEEASRKREIDYTARVGTREKRALMPDDIAKFQAEKSYEAGLQPSEKIFALDKNGNVVNTLTGGPNENLKAIEVGQGGSAAGSNEKIDKEIARLKTGLAIFQDYVKDVREAKGKSGAVGGMSKEIASKGTGGMLFPKVEAVEENLLEKKSYLDKLLIGSAPRSAQIIMQTKNAFPRVRNSDPAFESKSKTNENSFKIAIRELEALKSQGKNLEDWGGGGPPGAGGGSEDDLVQSLINAHKSK